MFGMNGPLIGYVWGYACDAYFCYTKYQAILLFACVDAAELFTYLRLDEAGSAGDAACFNRSGLGLRIQEYLTIPQG